MFVYVLLLTAATLGVVKEAQPNNIRLPIKRVLCKDGTVARGDEKCRDISPEDGPINEAPPPREPAPSLQRLPKFRNNPSDWVTINDYPSRSLSREEEGVSGFRAEIGVDGRVSACTITASSGWPTLDFATCRNVTRRARFDPALDDHGNPTISYYSSTVSWRIPADPSYASQIALTPTGPQAAFGSYIEIDETDYPLEALEKGWQGIITVALTISVGGSVIECNVKARNSRTSIGQFDAKSCELASRWTFLPARDPAGNVIAGEAFYDIVWNLPDAWKYYQQAGVYPKKSVE